MQGGREESWAVWKFLGFPSFGEAAKASLEEGKCIFVILKGWINVAAGVLLTQFFF